MLLYKEAIKMLTIVKKKEKEKKAELMFLFNIGLSPLISKQAFWISRTDFLFPFVNMVNSSRGGILLQFDSP